jgi:hypothetical protein
MKQILFKLLMAYASFSPYTLVAWDPRLCVMNPEYLWKQVPSLFEGEQLNLVLPKGHATVFTALVTSIVK